ncbi:meprin A, alpha (PABA peptide hydrolase), tandem duplicate 1 [Acipenser oxyrinchus oxyrinchus]|uniref:Metalloendopeptidase n=1 Tax=Acipenser oxyrinchus oxyrinchus TaxID=40147 RepID=A0AAD8GCL0_ACIOX|nr:meprin A, alpha (PABA peptide hydrolase), tandem duplicate 1 [Acipenser oxyrinchus oxyrinchus]
MGFFGLLCFVGLVTFSNTYTIQRLSKDKAFAIDDKQKRNDIPFLNSETKTPVVEGDMALPPGRNALRNTTYRWTFPIPYILGDSLDLNAKGVIYQAFEMYRLKSCVEFKPYEGEKSFIKFEKLDGCWSQVGDLQTGQYLSLGEGCDYKATIEHELLHALGFYHEQSRSDRDDYINIWWNEVLPGMEHNFVKYDDSFITDQNTPYDYESIMHYGAYSFNKNSSIPSITAKIPELTSVIGQYLDFSSLDLKRLNRMYNCSSSLTLLDQCAFEYINICGMIQNSKDDGDWVHVKSSSGMEDHTLIGQCKDAGYFMYFNTKTGQRDETAILESRTLYPKRSLQCLQFFYKMTGSPKDKLLVWIRMDDGTGNVRKLVKAQTFWGDKDHSWKIAHVPLKANVKFRYMFQGVRGDPTHSDGGIFIDDISLAETRCPSGVWQIKNFTGLLKTTTTGDSILSPRFYSPEGYGYGIELLPHSYYGYIGAFFHLTSGENDAFLEWPAANRQITITVIDQDPDVRLRLSSSRSFTTSGNHVIPGTNDLYWDNPSKTGTYDPSCACYRSWSWGWNALFSHNDLNRRNYLKNDDLIVFIDFEDLTPLIKTEVPVKPVTSRGEHHDLIQTQHTPSEETEI